MLKKITILLLFSSIAVAQTLTSNWQIVEIGEYIGAHRMLAVDSDNDGLDEIYLSSQMGGLRLEYVNDNYFTTGYTDLNSKIGNFILASDFFYINGKLKIITIKQDGLAKIFDGVTFQKEREFEIFQYVTGHSEYSYANDCRIFDLDNDGNNEIIISCYDILFIKDYEDNSLICEISTINGINATLGGKNLDIANVDSDPDFEILCSDGTVFDFNTQQVERKFPLGFSSSLTTEDINDDAIEEIIFTNEVEDSIFVINGENFETIWKEKVDNRIASIVFENVQGDDRKEMILGTNFQTSLYVYDIQNFSRIQEISDINTTGVSNIALGDPDGDGDKELIWGVGSSSSGPDNLLISDATGGAREWSNVDIAGGYSIDLFSGENNLPRFFGLSSKCRNFSDGCFFIWSDIFEDFTIQSTRQFNNSIQGLIYSLLCHKNISNGNEYLLLGQNKKVLIFDINSEEIRTVDIEEGYSPDVVELSFFDYDTDGAEELITCSDNGFINFFDFETLDKEMFIEHDSTDIDIVHDIVFGTLEGEQIAFICGTKFINNIPSGVVTSLNLNPPSQNWIKYFPSNVAYSLMFKNFDNYGEKELYCGLQDGTLLQINPVNQNEVMYYKHSHGISGIESSDLNADEIDELIICADKLLVLDKINMEILFSGNQFDLDCSVRNLRVIDYDNDGKKNIIVATGMGIFEFESNLSPGNVRETSEYNFDGSFYLYQNYPNPFNPVTSIEFFLLNAAEVELDIYDALGRHIRNLYKGNKSAGKHKINFNASDLASGLYLYRLKSDNFSEAKKLLLLK